MTVGKDEREEATKHTFLLKITQYPRSRNPAALPPTKKAGRQHPKATASHSADVPIIEGAEAACDLHSMVSVNMTIPSARSRKLEALPLSALSC